MTRRAGQHETGWDGSRLLGGTAATFVEIAGPIGTEGWHVEFEQPTVDQLETFASGAPQPSWERKHRDPDSSPLVEGVLGLLHPRRRSQLLHLGTEERPNRAEQPRLHDLGLMTLIPKIEAGNDGSEVGKVDQRANAKSMGHLARTQCTHPSRFRAVLAS